MTLGGFERAGGNFGQTAIKTVRRILELDLDAKWPEAEEARLDARARLAKLLLGQGKEGDALAAIEAGIKGAQRESVPSKPTGGAFGRLSSAEDRLRVS